MKALDQIFYLDRIIDNVYPQLDQSTIDMIKNMNSDDETLRAKINSVITPETQAQLKDIGLDPEFTLEQVNGFRVKSIIEDSLKSDDPAIRQAAEAVVDAENAVFNPASLEMKLANRVLFHEQAHMGGERSLPKHAFSGSDKALQEDSEFLNRLKKEVDRDEKIMNDIKSYKHNHFSDPSMG